MKGRAAALIKNLGLQPHPEGGYYREIFRSARVVKPRDSRPTRRALTVIYYLLLQGQHSRWHRVRSDEVWCHLEGDPLELYCFRLEDAQFTRHVLAPLRSSRRAPIHPVPAGVWQAAIPLGAFSLVACFVAPGFEYDDFLLAAQDTAASAALRRLGPRYAKLL